MGFKKIKGWDQYLQGGKFILKTEGTENLEGFCNRGFCNKVFL